jgi:hypothetical protein
MADTDTSSYLRPQPPANPLDMITHVGQAADALGNIQVGKAVQGAIQPDGSIDRNGIAQALRGSVAGSMKAIPTLDAFEKLRASGHVADIAGLDNFQKRMAVVNHLFSQLAAKDNPSIEDVNSIAARVLDPGLRADKFGLTFPVVMNALKNFRGPDGRPLPPTEIKKRALDMQLMTAETGQQLEALHPGYDITDDGTNITAVPRGNKMNPQTYSVPKRQPTGSDIIDQNPNSPTYRQTVKVPPQPPVPPIYTNDRGEPQGARGVVRSSPVPVPRPAPDRATMGQTEPTPANGLPATFAERYAPQMRGAPVASLPPGQSAAIQKTAENSAQLFNNLTTAANEVPMTRTILNNLDKNIDEFTSGPGADWQRVAKAFVNANVPKSFGDVFNPKTIASQESFNKQAQQLAQRQFQQLGGTGTDAKLDSAMHTSPNELLSHMGNKEIVAILKGNADALDVQSREANKWKKTHGEETYADFIADFNQHFNPRVFQYQYIPKGDRQAFYKAMSPDERRQFEIDAQYALGKKWIKP